MEITMYWGNSYIMTFIAWSEEEFIKKVLDHVEKYWTNLDTEDFSKAWQEVFVLCKGSSGRFEFIGNGA